ncbi:MAG: hypothetical protein AAF590_02700 [Pseudomonadota bacterium]
MQSDTKTNSRIILREGSDWTRIDVRVRENHGLFGGATVGIFVLAPFLFFPLSYYLFRGYQFSAPGEVLLLVQIAILFVGCVAAWGWAIAGRRAAVVWKNELQRAWILPPLRFISRDPLSSISGFRWTLNVPQNGAKEIEDEALTGTISAERTGRSVIVFNDIDADDAATLLDALSQATSLPVSGRPSAPSRRGSRIDR